MLPFGRSVYVFLVFPVVLLLAFALDAQTLTHRPAVTPQTPPAPSMPVNAGTPLPPTKPMLAQGTNLQVEITRHCPMKANEQIEARLLHPIFAQGKMVVPQNTLLRGIIVALEPDTKTRWHSRLRGDFTPFHTARVQFNQLLLPDGALDLSTGGAASGAPFLQLTAAGTTAQQSFISRYWTQAKIQLHDRVAYFRAPGFGDRALQLLYHQLPFHPERIEAHTMWSFDLAAPLVLPDSPPVDPPPDSAAPVAGKPEVWSIHALLMDDLTSASAKPGDQVKALVIEPVFDKDRTLVVPQDSILIGRVTTAKAAHALGRNGKLRFTFQEVRFPEAMESSLQGRPVEGLLSGATAERAQGLTLDAEGTISPGNQSSVIAPLLLTMLAGRALDDDGNLTVGTGVASNGFGLVGRVVGVAAGNRNLAAGLGYYAAALSLYEDFLRRGCDVVFPRNTRIEIDTTPLRANVLTPESH
ncbi:MAG: hypothetical protein ACLPY1_18845 [Terracidiphilus sp.]